MADRADLTLAERTDRHLAGGEEAANEHDQEDDEDVPGDLAHVLLPSLDIPPQAGRGGPLATAAHSALCMRAHSLRPAPRARIDARGGGCEPVPLGQRGGAVPR